MEWLDAFLNKFAGTASPNMPSRLFQCTKCGKIRSSVDLETGKCVGHKFHLADETLWNVFRWLVRL